MEELLKKILTPLLPRFAEPIMQKYQKTLNFPPREMIHTKLGIKKNLMDRTSKSVSTPHFFLKKGRKIVVGAPVIELKKKIRAACHLLTSTQLLSSHFLGGKIICQVTKMGFANFYECAISCSRLVLTSMKKLRNEEVLLLSCCFQKSITVKLLLLL